MISAALSINEHEFNSLRQLVLRYTGISLSEAKLELVKRRFSPRLRALGLESFGAYVDYLNTEPAEELAYFSDAITTNLTSFYREEHHFEYLARAMPAMIESHQRDRRLRFWSAGCSTGQEAYSLAITVLESMPATSGWDVKILATDIDRRCLAKGKEGIYDRAELEKAGKARVDKWFDPLSGTERVRAKRVLRELVTFKPLNFVDEFPVRGPFDAIFCRNVFIYFDKQMQSRCVDKFARVQRRGNYLFLGHSESIVEMTNDYRLVSQTTYERT